MVEVTLIGDSIRLGYQSVVERDLSSEARVWGPKENGGTSANVLAYLNQWVLRREPDIVHLNCGLHDLRTDRRTRRKAVPLAEYRKNLTQIFARIRRGTEARIIWATTTPVNQRRHNENKPFNRYEADVEAYNRAARRIAERMGVVVNDLFEVAMRAGRDAVLLPDGVHFTGKGSELLGKAVAAAIRACLKGNG